MNPENNEIHFSSCDMPDQERLDAWRLLLNPLFSVDLPVAADEPFSGEALITRLDCCLVASLKGTAQRHTRTRGLIASSRLTDILVCVCQKGAGIIDVNGRKSRMDAGDIGIFDLSQPVTCDMPQFQRLILVLPRGRFAATLAHGSPHGLVIPASAPLSRMIRTHLSVMAQLAATVTPVEAEDMLDAGILLLERVVRTKGDLPVDPKATLRETCRLAVMDYIEANLTDHHLSPERLAAIFRMSRATLYRLFEEEGGVAVLIQSRRLDRCFMELARSGERGRVVGVGEIAYTYGFGSEAHFSRIFRRRFGIPPSAARGSAPEISSDQSGRAASAPQKFHEWLAELGNSAMRPLERPAFPPHPQSPSPRGYRV